ncbi:centromere protein V [Folsomia candida]|uniref:Centromere protein V n=1 Tax=Folsomia candida TaxID=158441 RepID=A0A226EQ23_FOLCA|nr:centromere protein V [Folsomia candida]XP_035703711.1 centromere protein V [Folsomia candida]OXA59723.1 Centromere protein V [Folsomia candida]
MDNIKYNGSCHCGQVQWEVLAPRTLNAIDCNCTICIKKQNKHVIVPSAQFKLLSGQTGLSTYTFNTHQAKHMFCNKCGVQSFYIPRSNPDGIGFMPHCIDRPQPKVVVENFDGNKWEESMEMKGADISKRSKQ